jgi:hypothetical protein
MKEPRSVDIAGIGRVLFEPSSRARRIVIYVRPEKGVRVAVPRRTSFEAAQDFVRQKKLWIKKHAVKLEQDENRNRLLADSFQAVDRAEAKRRLIGKLKKLAEKYGFSYNRVIIRNQKTRWGSCSHKNAISLNIKLVILSEELQDYVIIHELVHTLVHDHSRKFWAELDKYVGSGKAWVKKLRQYDTRWI